MTAVTGTPAEYCGSIVLNHLISILPSASLGLGVSCFLLVPRSHVASSLIAGPRGRDRRGISSSLLSRLERQRRGSA